MNRFLRNPITLRFLTMLFLVVAASTLPATQPNMHDALDALHRAKGSAHPLEDLEAAVQSLENGTHNKLGNRAAAIPIVKQAIAAFKSGDRVGADKLVDEAIARVDKAVAAGHRN